MYPAVIWHWLGEGNYSLGRMRRYGPNFSRLIGIVSLLALFCLCAYGQSETRSCPAGVGLSIDWDYVFPSYGGASGIKLIYEIRRPASVSSAWVEVWDGGLRLFHQEVPVRARGDFKWMHLREVPETPSSLTLAVFDPGLPLLGEAPSGPSKAGIDYRSTYWAGNSPQEEPPFLVSEGFSYRIEEDSERGDLQLNGLFAGAQKEILLEQQDEQGRWIAREYLLPNVLDMNQIEVQIPERYLDKPGILGVSNKVDGLELELGSEVKPPQKTVYVSSKDSPTLSEVTPSEISASEVNEGPFHIPIQLHGSGFTPASSVVQSLYDHEPQNSGRTRFISPSDLEFDLYKDEIVADRKGSAIGPIRLWVVDGDWLHVSEPLEIRIEASTPGPPAPSTTQAPRINSISPNPVPLIDPAGPAFQTITALGEHFREGESVDAMIVTANEEKTIRLKTQFTSSQELRALLPRNLWTMHHLTYRFGAKTQAGTCSVEIAEDDDN